MNTFRIFSLIALVGIASAQVRAMDELSEKARTESLIDLPLEITEEMNQASQLEAPQESSDIEKVVANEVSKLESVKNNSDLADLPKDTSPSAIKHIQEALNTTGITVKKFASDHPWYTASGVVAVIIAGGLIEHFVCKNGHIKSVTEFCKEHNAAVAAFGTALLVVGTGLILEETGTVNISARALRFASWVSSFVPESIKPHFTLTNSAILTTLLGGSSYAVNKYRQPALKGGKAEDKKEDANSSGKQEKEIDKTPKEEKAPESKGRFARLKDSVTSLRSYIPYWTSKDSGKGSVGGNDSEGSKQNSVGGNDATDKKKDEPKKIELSFVIPANVTNKNVEDAIRSCKKAEAQLVLDAYKKTKSGQHYIGLVKKYQNLINQLP